MNGILISSKKCLNSVRRVIYSQILIRSLTFKVESLDVRSLIKISGNDIYSFLQGLITNDIRQLNEHKKSLYTLFLNNKGRVMCDSILYKYKDENTLLIECDSKIENDLKCHLKNLRVRKKINIESVDEKLWVIYNKNESALSANIRCDEIKSIEQMTFCFGLPLQGDPNYDYYLDQKLAGLPIILYKDPRMFLLGIRAIVPQTVDLIEDMKKVGINLNLEGDNYTMLRYRLGVCEGITELPVEKCFPLEVNCDYLHGVSFHKGCYLGQELTARTHHTGVVRKRLMPLIFNSVPNSSLPFDSIVTMEDKKNVGKLRGHNGKYGIGLLRISEVLESPTKLIIDKFSASTYIPLWWPQQALNNIVQNSKQ